MGEVIISLAKKQAMEIQSSLDPKIPSLIIVMLPSQVSGGYWLRIPKEFCTDFMLKKDKIKMTLVDQKGEKYEVTYIPGSTGLSGRWKRFAVDHNLRVGDAVLFQLVNLMKFKVFIVRENGVADTDGGADTDDDGADIDGAISLLQLKAQMQKNSRGDAGMKPEKKPAAKPQMTMQRKPAAKPQMTMQKKPAPAATSLKHSNENGSPSLAVGGFKDINKFKSFAIIVNGSVVDSELPKHVRAKYYKLCCRQNSFLHANLVPGLGCKEVAGIISETVKIADAIRSCTLIDTPKGELEVWKKSLGEFEQLGMSVSFLIPRLGELMQVSERAVLSMSYSESAVERTKAELAMKTLKMKHLKLKDAMKRFAFDIRAPGVIHAKFIATMNAPW
ncbi:hypothetical protein MKX01_039488 [Papaver californicum]|nr:hypothetical protein MKX01_039488 [Papaver californicum]